MSLVIRTSRISYEGQDKLDISVKNGSVAFAPTWGMVMDYKHKRITDQEYTEQYFKRMRGTFFLHHDEWDALLSRKSITLCCFCKPGAFCHRHLLKDMLIKFAKSRGIEVIDGGEVK